MKGDEGLASVFQVARYILNHTGGMTTMKLEKLVYYCHAWSLAWDGVPYSLAITGRQRAWGIMIQETGTFRLLWYDPQHEIYQV